MYNPIKDYAIVGNLRSAALVSKRGSIDWFPAPFIDSPSVFASILDTEKGGLWSVSPADESYNSSQAYVENTNVVVTTFYNEDTSFEVRDFIPIEYDATDELSTSLSSGKIEIMRKITCTKGTCNAKVVFRPRFNYGRGETELSRVDGGVFAINESHKATLSSDADFTIEDGFATAYITLQEGENCVFSFQYDANTCSSDCNKRYDLEESRVIEFWQEWARTHEVVHTQVFDEWHEAVIRSALTLKILFFEPTGTIAAAATTSLPEEIGGVRNWDYRFTWLRDSAFVLQAFFRMGHTKEAKKYVRWLIKECYISGNPKDLQIMYGLRGETDLTEEFLPHLEGYRRSKPVRVGNNAFMQDQWDIYGNVLDTIWRLHVLENNDHIETDTWNLIRGVADHVTQIWKHPDEGLWEIRGGRQHFLYSKVMCWVALDRAIKFAEKFNLEGEKETWIRHKDEIKKTVFTRGWNESKRSFVQSFGSDALDSSVLLLPSVGFIDGNDPRMKSTIDAIERELSLEEGLLLRYRSGDGLPGEEGAFLVASFWLIDALIFCGEKVRAKNLMEKIHGLTNHVGLYAEEYDPQTKEFIGNFPQAYTHIGFINSAFNLSMNEDFIKHYLLD